MYTFSESYHTQLNIQVSGYLKKSFSYTRRHEIWHKTTFSKVIDCEAINTWASENPYPARIGTTQPVI